MILCFFPFSDFVIQILLKKIMLVLFFYQCIFMSMLRSEHAIAMLIYSVL